MGESITFWVLAVVSVIAALGLVFSRKAVYSALMLGVVMLSLAVLYAVQDAPFLAAVQIIVYTGAVMMLFLFVLMLVGVDSSDSLVETIKGQRFWALVAGLAFAALLGLAVGNAVLTAPRGLAVVNDNVPSLAEKIFTRHVFAFEVTSALLITAALGAMVLAHRERTTPKPTQKDLSRRRFVEFGKSGKNPAPLPGPGVYARHNSIDMPALLPDGSVSPLSVNRVIARHEAAEGTLPAELVKVLEQEPSPGGDTVAEQARSSAEPVGEDTEPMPEEALTGQVAGGRSRTEEDGK